MKRILAALLTAVCAVTLGYAQYTKQGTIEFGGSAGYTSQVFSINTVEQYKKISWFLAPEVYYFVIDNLALGAAISSDHQEIRFPGVTGNISVSNNSIVIEPTYVFDAGNTYPYAGLLFAAGSSSVTRESPLNGNGAQVGIKVPVMSNGLLNLGLRYLMGKIKISGTEYDSSSVIFVAGFSLYK